MHGQMRFPEIVAEDEDRKRRFMRKIARPSTCRFLGKLCPTPKICGREGAIANGCITPEAADEKYGSER